MATAVEVASLFSTLGLRLDRNAWKRGDDAIAGTRSALGGLAKLAAGAFAGLSFGAAIKSGLSFNATTEQTRDQIAGMLALAKHTDLSDQLADSEGLMASLQERAKKLPGSLMDYTKVLGMIAQPITDAGIGLKDLEDITVGAAVAAKAFNIDLEAAARDVNQAMMGQFHSVDQLTGRILGSLGYVGEAGRKRFNELSKARRAAVLKEALTQKQLAQLADAQSKNALGRWDTFKANLVETLGRVAAPLFVRLSSLLATVNEWLDKNSATVERVADAVGGVLGAAFGALLDTIDWLTSGSDEATAVLIGIAVAIGTIVVPALLSMAAAWIAGLAPILAIIAAVALVALGITKLVKHWDKVAAAAKRVWGFIKKWGLLALGPIVFGIQKLVEYWDDVVEAGRNAWAAIKQAAADALDWIIKKARQVPILGWLGEKLGQGAGFVVSRLGGDTELDGIDRIVEAPTVSAPMFTPPVGAGARNITVGPTTVTVQAAPGMDEERIGQIAGAAAREKLDDALRAED